MASRTSQIEGVGRQEEGLMTKAESNSLSAFSIDVINIFV